jgi:hypothetical protein
VVILRRVNNMLVVGINVSETKIKVDGCFVDGSQALNIEAVTPPNPPENQIGKDAILFLDTIKKELFWEYIDRPLTNEEKINLMQSALDDLILGGAL